MHRDKDTVWKLPDLKLSAPLPTQHRLFDSELLQRIGAGIRHADTSAAFRPEENNNRSERQVKYQTLNHSWEFSFPLTENFLTPAVFHVC